MQKKYISLIVSFLLCSSTYSTNAVNAPGFLVGIAVMIGSLFSDEQSSNPDAQKPKQPVQASNHFYQKLDITLLQDELEKTLREIINLNKQSDADCIELWKIKKRVIDDTINEKFSTHIQAKTYAYNVLAGEVTEYVIAKGANKSVEKITDQSKKQQARKEAEEYFRKIAIQKNQNKELGSLLENIDRESGNFAAKFNAAHHANPYANASAPAREEPQQTPLSQLYPELPAYNFPTANQPTIQEIFPKDATAQTIKQIIHQDECTPCGEEFTIVGKRITLRCGHQICPQCLLDWKFSQAELQRQRGAKVEFTCPFCRQEISEKDFSADYISSKL